MERRNFIRVAASTAGVPFLFQGQWLKAMAGQSVFELLNAFNSKRKLVMVQLNGGNDGLNTLIPTSEYDNLAVQRANILLPKAQILKLTDETGLHPSMPEIVSLYKIALDENQKLADLILIAMYTGARIEEICSLLCKNLTSSATVLLS